MSLPPGATLVSGSVPESMKLPPGAELVSGSLPEQAPEATPGAFQTKPGGKVYNAETLGSEPLTPVPGTSMITAARARVGLPQFPQQVQQSKNEEAAMLPEAGAMVGSATGPEGSALGAALGTLSKTFLNNEPVDPSEAVKNAAKAWVSQKAFDLLPVAAQKTWHFFAGDTSEGAAWRAVNEALGVKASQVRMAPGTGDIADAYNIPGRSVLNETGLTGKDLSRMTPFEQAEAIKPHMDAAGRKVSALADAASVKGITFDAGTSLRQAIGKMDSPQMQDQALKVVTDTAKGLGVLKGSDATPDEVWKLWSKATPNDALKLRRALYDSLPARYRAPLYGAVSGDLKAAVPELVPADQTYSELRTAVDATTAKAKKMAVTAPESGLDRLISGLKKNAVPLAAGAAAGAGIPALGYALKYLLPSGH